MDTAKEPSLYQWARDRLEAEEKARVALEKSVGERFDHVEQLSKVVREAAAIASEKAEKGQSAVNIASNEWRATLTDFRTTTASRTELDRLANDFAAYKLEVAQALVRATREQRTEGKEDIKGWISIVISIAVAIILLASFILPHAAAH